MPPKAKLHSKNGKPKRFPKAPAPLPVSQPSTSENDSNIEESERKFEVELVWCIQQLERSLENTNLNPKLAEDSSKILKVLKSNNQPIVRKRQLMRQHFGDYRSKMAAEEKKAKKAGSKMIISTVVPSSSKSTFIRKCATLAMGDNSFRFNFPTPQNVPEENIPLPENVSHSIQNGTSSTETSTTNITNSIKNLYFGSEQFKFNFDVNGRT